MTKKDFEKLVKECETNSNYVDYNGKRYYIDGEVYPDTDKFGDLIFLANAYTGEFQYEDCTEDDDELKYSQIAWYPVDDYDESDEDLEYACDWEHPDSVKEF